MRVFSHTCSTRRWLVVPLVVLSVSAGSAAASQSAAAAPRVAPAPAATTPTASVAGWPSIVKILKRLAYRGRPIVSRATTRTVRDVAVDWSRQQVINWYCWQWYGYFGYDFDAWSYAADYYANPRWAWNFCAAYWR